MEKDLAEFVQHLPRAEVSVNGKEFVAGGSDAVVEVRRLLRGRLLEKTGKNISLPADLINAGLVMTVEKLVYVLWPLVRAQANASALA